MEPGIEPVPADSLGKPGAREKQFGALRGGGNCGTCAVPRARYAGAVSTTSGQDDSTAGRHAGATSAGQVFATTHWSLVLCAREKDSPASTQALDELCRAYWYPLYAYARRTGQSPSDAQDLTQGFFARLLDKNYLASADREKGRFRTFLLVAFKRYAANEWDREHAGKRGGFAVKLPIDGNDAEIRFRAAPGATPDVLFDRQWATTLLDRTLAALQEEYVASGRSKLLEYLRPCLAGEESALPYAQIAARMNLTEAAVKMAVQRLRARYGQLLRAEIAHTVSSPEEIEQELRELFLCFGS